MQAASRVQQAWDALDAVPDPEIPVVSIRELGILRDVREDEVGLEIVITPTYSGCPAMDQIADDIHAALAQRQLSARITTQLAPACHLTQQHTQTSRGTESLGRSVQHARHTMSWPAPPAGCS